ncbi:hypothetical protein B0H34DRAFT_322411 [Crassisporium funariophilum]|nr:hypothetical protein B0H34DRAFT_322411 [Crassisporium funariophilum]
MPPTAYDDAIDEARLDRLRLRIFSVESDILQLQARHEQLTTECTKLIANIAAKRIGNSPMRDLIPELCHIIFAYCSDVDCDLDCNASEQAFQNSFPLVLTRVCTRWRDMVVNNPYLWKTIHVQPRMTTNSTARVQLWLDRSANMPLRVIVCPSNLLSMGWTLQTIGNWALPLMIQLLPHFHRIQSLKTYLGMDILTVLFPSRKVANMPFLEELSLLIDEHYHAPPGMRVLQAPNLRVLHMRDITPLVDVLVETLPRLFVLTIDDCEFWKHPRAFPSMLASCSQLQCCILTFPCSLFFLELEPIILPELRHLKLVWPFLFDPAPIFRALRAPKLQSLYLCHLTRQLILPPHTLSSLRDLVKSATGLNTLTVVGCNLLTPEESTLLLQAAKNLERLDIINCQRGDRFLVPLTISSPDSTPPNPATWVCPHLTHVKITGLQDSDVRPVINFAKSRLNIKGTGVSEALEGGTYLKVLALDSDIHDLTRQARLLMLSGLVSVHRFLDIEGPFGELFYPK